MPEKKPHIVLAVPTYDQTAHTSIIPPLIELMKTHPTSFMSVGRSLLANCFNMLWCMARNQKDADYFLMLHADIIPEPTGLAKIIAEAQCLDADLLSAVVPIKNAEGMTSTALGDPDDEWARPRRLTMREAMDLPETFSAADVDPGKLLLVNTGLMVANLRKPWVEDAHFEIRDRIVEVGGQLQPQVIPEDWGFSRFVASRGGKVFATRKVTLLHAGMQFYPNDQAWGTKATDTPGDEVSLLRVA